jgi:hypothetical protein
MATITPAFLQSGTWNGTSWVNTVTTPGFPNVATGVQYWAQFDFTQAGQSYLTSASVDWQFGVGGVGFTFIIDLLFMEGAVTEDFSTANRPISTKTIPAYYTVTVPAGQTDTLTLDLNNADGSGTQVAAGLRTGRSPDANGVIRAPIGFQLNADSVSPLPGAGFTQLNLEGELQFTGIEGRHWAHGRADECPKCGSKSTRDTWTRDGYTDMMVCKRCYDEEDLVGRHYQGLGSERPGQGEG